MSKRSRRTKDDARHITDRAGQARNADEAKPADHSHAEPTLVVSGAAFQKFDAWVDSELDGLVQRWIHTAAPSAALIRRAVPEASRNQA